LVEYFKVVFLFTKSGLKSTIADLSKEVTVNIKYINKYLFNLRLDCATYLYRNYIKLGLHGSIVEYDGYYHTKKCKLDKLNKNIPSWFGGLCIHKFVERDFNDYDNHSQFTFIIFVESQFALKGMHGALCCL